jgi:coproporphyrinogen III oxidase-like Fe-S oxidoreductase
VRLRERLLLALRLDEPLSVSRVDAALDYEALSRVEELGLVRRRRVGGGGDAITLTPRGRFLGGAVTAELLA